MIANKFIFVVATSVACLMVASAPAIVCGAEIAGFTPSPEFVQAAALVYAPWNNFAGFKATEKAIKLMADELAALPEAERSPEVSGQLKNLRTMLSFLELKPEKCSKISNEIAAVMEKNLEFRSNLMPYLWVVRSRHVAYCADPQPSNRGAPPNYKTIATEDTLAMPVADESKPDDSHKCDAKCLGDELGLPALELEGGEQLRRIAASRTFRQALRVIYRVDEDASYRLYFPRALRQIVNELSEADRADGGLDEPLTYIMEGASALLEICTPEPSKCDTVFERFSYVLPMDYTQLSHRGSLKEYAKECLLSITIFCSHF